MYKRTKQALINSTPPLYTCMFEAQFGKAEYSNIAFAITTRIDSAGCFGVIEYQDMDTICINSKVNGKQPSLQDRVYAIDGCATAITTGYHPSIADRYEGMQVEQIDDKIVETSYRIRKLTPRECFRLMGVEDKDIDTIQASGVSNSQQYKMAGNSIVVDCLYHLFRKMFTETESEDRQLTLF